MTSPDLHLNRWTWHTIYWSKMTKYFEGMKVIDFRFFGKCWEYLYKLKHFGLKVFLRRNYRSSDFYKNELSWQQRCFCYILFSFFNNFVHQFCNIQPLYKGQELWNLRICFGHPYFICILACIFTYTKKANALKTILHYL